MTEKLEFNTFNVVFSFVETALFADFVIQGIFTLRSDADALAEKLSATGHKAVTVTDSYTLWMLKDHLLKERLGNLNNALLGIEGLLTSLNICCSKDSGNIQLIGKGPFPIAVAKPEYR